MAYATQQEQSLGGPSPEKPRCVCYLMPDSSRSSSRKRTPRCARLISPGRALAAADERRQRGGAAFIASPVFSRVADTVPTTITASPVVVSRLGVACQTVMQNITIDGQNVHASALVCRQPNGSWHIEPRQSALIPPGD